MGCCMSRPVVEFIQPCLYVAAVASIDWESKESSDISTGFTFSQSKSNLSDYDL